MDNRRSFLKSMGIGLASLIPLKLLNNESLGNEKTHGGLIPYSDKYTYIPLIPLKYDYARNVSESANPDLWKGLVGAWLPAQGITEYAQGITEYLDDRWYKIIQVGANRLSQDGRGITCPLIIYDADAMSGQFTIRLISLMKRVYRYQPLPNIDDNWLENYKITDLYVSQNVFEDIETWTKHVNGPVYLNDITILYYIIHGVKIHSLAGLEENGKYMKYFYENGNLLPKDKTELVIGLNTHNNLNSNTSYDDKVILGSI